MFDDHDRETPATVVGAIAAGVAPAPFLVTYSVLFILHGTVFPVDPPDITGSRGGETLAGVIALVFLGAIILGLGWFLSRRTRWFFLAGQLTTLAVSIDLLVDSTSGQPQVPIVLALTSTASIVLGCLPPSWNWTSDKPPAAPGRRRRSAAQPRRARHAPTSEFALQGSDWDEETRHGPGIWPVDPNAGPYDPNPGGGHGVGSPRSA